jgi:hypothetical protein
MFDVVRPTAALHLRAPRDTLPRALNSRPPTAAAEALILRHQFSARGTEH